MLHPLVLYMPAELGLELVPSIGSDGIDPKRELLDHIINELDGAPLGVQSPPWCYFGQPVKAVASQDTVDSRF